MNYVSPDKIETLPPTQEFPNANPQFLTQILGAFQDMVILFRPMKITIESAENCSAIISITSYGQETRISLMEKGRQTKPLVLELHAAIETNLQDISIPCNIGSDPNYSYNDATITEDSKSRNVHVDLKKLSEFIVLADFINVCIAYWIETQQTPIYIVMSQDDTKNNRIPLPIFLQSPHSDLMMHRSLDHISAYITECIFTQSKWV